MGFHFREIHQCLFLYFLCLLQLNCRLFTGHFLFRQCLLIGSECLSGCFKLSTDLLILLPKRQNIIGILNLPHALLPFLHQRLYCFTFPQFLFSFLKLLVTFQQLPCFCDSISFQQIDFIQLACL